VVIYDNLDCRNTHVVPDVQRATGSVKTFFCIHRGKRPCVLQVRVPKSDKLTLRPCAQQEHFPIPTPYCKQYNPGNGTQHSQTLSPLLCGGFSLTLSISQDLQLLMSSQIEGTTPDLLQPCSEALGRQTSDTVGVCQLNDWGHR